MREETRDNGRRNIIRGLVGGGTAAALAGTTALLPAPARAETPAAPGGDPFALPEFRPNGRVREFWIQAESFEHNAVPNGYDAMMGRHLTPEQTTFWAIGYRAYTPGWASPLDPDLGPDGIGSNSGIPGPVLRAEVGDVVLVHFRNNDAHYRWPHSVHPHGVVYDRDSDGGWLADDPQRPGSAVPYGESFTYTWLCHPSSAGTWPYHDHSAPQSTAPRAAASADSAPRHGGGGADDGHDGGHDAGTDGGHDGAAAGGHDTAHDSGHDDMVMEIGAQLGLFGVLVVTDQQTPAVDREFVLFLHDVSRRDVRSLTQNLDMFNGGAYLDNTPTYTAKAGDRVRWRIAALGNDFHVFHIHGHRWRSRQGYQGWVDSQIIGPSTTLTIEYTEDNPGDWVYHCHVADHMTGGMVGRYRVAP